MNNTKLAQLSKEDVDPMSFAAVKDIQCPTTGNATVFKIVPMGRMKLIAPLPVVGLNLFSI